MVVTIEPGVYKEGKHGIRIENVVVVEEDIETEYGGKFMKFEVLSYCANRFRCYRCKYAYRKGKKLAK